MNPGDPQTVHLAIKLTFLDPSKMCKQPLAAIYFPYRMSFDNWR